MRRQPILDKKTGFISQIFHMESSLERAEYEKSVLRNPPPGYLNAVRWLNQDEFVIGPVTDLAQPVAALPAPANEAAAAVPIAAAADDGLDKLTVAQLKTRCARSSITYTTYMERGELIAMLRAKTPATQVVGVGE